MQPSDPAVCVETNWIIDIILGRDDGAARMLDLARDGQIAVHVPSLCLAESVKVIEAQRQVWRDLEASIATQEGQIRSARTLALDTEQLRTIRKQIAALRDTVESVLWSTLEHVSRHARLIDITHTAIVRSAAYRDALKLAPADAMILSAVVQAREAGACRMFMSKNTRDFATPELLTFFEEHEVTYLPSPTDFLRSIRSAG